MLLPHFNRPVLFPKVKFQDFKLPHVPGLKHWEQFVNACRGEGKTTADFAYAGPLTETILLGDIAARFPHTELKWNSWKMKFNLSEANQYVRRKYHKGWKLKDFEWTMKRWQKPSRSLLIRLWPWLVVLLALLFIGFIRFRLLDMPLERDEGEYAYAGQLILQGIPPFELAYNMKLPGTYFAYALGMAVVRAEHSGNPPDAAGGESGDHGICFSVGP